MLPAGTIGTPMLKTPIACLLAWGCLQPPCAASPFDDALPPRVEAALAQAGLPPEALGAIAMPRTFWARTWQHRADAVMQPGSAMKVVTTVVALDQLGPNHRGRTELLAAGAIDGAVLDGDLVLKGGADTDLDLPALWQMLYALRLRGVREIAGDLVLDRTRYWPPRTDVGLPPFDDAPEWPYNVVPDALMLEGSLVSYVLSSDGSRVRARNVPPLEGVDIDSSALALTDTPCADWDEDWQPPQVTQPAPGRWRIALAGGFARHCEAQARLQLLDRSVAAERQVRAVWASLGGTFRKAPGAVREAAAPAGSVRVAVHEARAWGEVLRPMNKSSDNALTRLLFLELGAAASPGNASADTLDSARRAVDRWLDERGIARPGLVMDNGSGLSRSERITPRTMARLIDAALDSPYAPELLMSLPQAGVDGTMRQRLKGTRAEGRARLKTGTLRNVVALAGTVRDTRGDDWVLVAFINHEQAHRGRPVLDALVEWVAESGARWR
jgi:serine-type D-Ala-D-Ala carboxypeptidase/endopeptidase (penicillin-binding protein 4)